MVLYNVAFGGVYLFNSEVKSDCWILVFGCILSSAEAMSWLRGSQYTGLYIWRGFIRGYRNILCGSKYVFEPNSHL